MSSALKTQMVFPAAALLVMCGGAFFILPAIDDWTTSSPIRALDGSALLPGTFWRPFETLLRRSAGEASWLHPFLFHLLAISGHVLSTAILYLIARRLHPASGVAAAVATIYAIFPGCAAAVWSVDSAIQTNSTAFGLLGTFVLMRRTSKREMAFAAAALWVAALWKESGIAWFAAAPLFVMAARSENAASLWKRDNLIPLAAGLVNAVLYLVLRSALAQTPGLGADEGRYALQLDPAVWLVNATLLLGAAVTTLDTVAFFGTGDRVFAIGMLILGLPLLIGGGRAVVSAASLFQISICTVGVLAVLSPHLALGHVSEMYAHPVAAVVLVAFLSLVPRQHTFTRSWRALYGAMLLSASVVSAHKFSHMYATGKRAEAVAERILADYGDIKRIPETVCTIENADNTGHGYSVFYAGSAVASNRGRSVWAATDWRKPVTIINVETGDACPESCVHVWHVTEDGVVTIRKNP